MMDVVSRSDRQSAAEQLRQQIDAARMLLVTYHDVLDDDAQGRADAVEGETNLREAIQIGIVRIAEIKAMRAGIKSFMDSLKIRYDRLELQDENLRTAILIAMEVGEVHKLETPLGTVTRKAVPPSVVVTDESAIPAQFWRRSDPSLDRRALLDALKNLGKDERIPGAELSNGGTTVQIR